MRKYASANMWLLLQICTDPQSDQATYGRANKYGREYSLSLPMITLKDVSPLLYSKRFPEFNECSLWGLFCCQVRTVPAMCYVKQGDPGLVGELGPPGLKGLQVSHSSLPNKHYFNSAVTPQSFGFVLFNAVSFLQADFPPYIPFFIYYFLILGRYRPARAPRSGWASGPESNFISSTMHRSVTQCFRCYTIRLLTTAAFC